MGSDLDAMRHHLLSLSRQEDKRLIDVPNDWRPYEVVNPAEARQQFNHETAWELIVHLLESGHPMKPALQRFPPETVAYEMVHCLADGWTIYIKIRVGKRDRIYGRSFHYSER